MSSERTLEDHFCKRFLLHLQGGGKTPLVYPRPSSLNLLGCGCFGPCQLGKWERGEGESWSGSVELGLS